VWFTAAVAGVLVQIRATRYLLLPQDLPAEEEEVEAVAEVEEEA
jgi:hypothetical protein